MQIIKTFSVAFIIVAPFLVKAQSALLHQGSKEYLLLDRLEIKMQTDSVYNFSFIKPFNRKWWVDGLGRASNDQQLSLSKVDRYNISRSRLNNLEWSGDGSDQQLSRKALFKNFFKDPANFVGVRQKDFFLSLNPVLQLQAIRDDATDELLYQNTRGVVVRSLIAQKVAFMAYLTENQEKPPVFVKEQNLRMRSVPGAGLYRRFKETGFDYFDARGAIYFNAAKFVDLSFGYDKFFLGNGYRSLFFGDHGASHLFLNMNLRVWKLNYVSRVMELTAQYTRNRDRDTLYPKKYAVVHHLSINVPKWLTLGLFESVVFARPNQFEFNYLNPVMFLRGAELSVGSPDNSFLGIDAKANLAKRMQVYSQIFLDEFHTRYIRERKGWWGNKWAFQAGMKYIDLLGVKNLDLQLETNWIRPFTYSHFDTIANYTHYNQAIAHPLQSNIKEYIGILRYQPAPKWYLQAKLIQWQSGVDSAGKNFGNNIFLDNNTRAMPQYGYFFGTPVARKNSHANLWLAYEWKENLFVEGNINLRKTGNFPTNGFASLGIRWNIQRRDYDY
ncbi:MAG: hypothetical protein RJB03_1832 [Bacteroidota bacterium]|jgi:hypothetical protein